MLSGSERSAGLFFFFQAEDGIRDVAVTGVQTCALPISIRRAPGRLWPRRSLRRAASAAETRRARCWRSSTQPTARRSKTGRSSTSVRDRKSGVEGKRGDLGGRRIIKKKKEKYTGEGHGI